MQIIRGITTTDANLLYSSIPEDDAPVWQSEAHYILGNIVVYNHKIYECIKAITNSATPPNIDLEHWLSLGATNRWRMFDNLLHTKTTSSTDIVVRLKPEDVITGVTLLGVIGTRVRIKVTDINGDVVYENIEEVSGGVTVGNYFDYFFSPIQRNKNIVSFLDLPYEPLATVEVVIEATTIAEVGELVYGERRNIGNTNYGTRIGLRSFSRKETDEFGNTNVVKRRNSKYAEYDISINNYHLAEVQDFFSAIDSVPCVFIGNPNMDELIVYGFYNDFQATIAYPTVSKCTLRVEGLI